MWPAGPRVSAPSWSASPAADAGGAGEDSGANALPPALRPLGAELQSPFCPIGPADLPERYDEGGKLRRRSLEGSGTLLAELTSPRTTHRIPPASAATDVHLHQAAVSWTWDAFSYAADLEYPLATFAMYLLRRSHLVMELDLEEEALERFLLAVDESYAPPYMVGLCKLNPVDT